MSSDPRPLANAPRTVAGQIRGGDAWVVPYEPGSPAWVTASAPEIRIIDRRASPAAAVLASERVARKRWPASA